MEKYQITRDNPHPVLELAPGERGVIQRVDVYDFSQIIAMFPEPDMTAFAYHRANESRKLSECSDAMLEDLWWTCGYPLAETRELRELERSR